jgi:uncharacterized membrane protein affecting hemolysin expression
MSPALVRPETFTSTISLDTATRLNCRAGDANALNRERQTIDSPGRRLPLRVSAMRGYRSTLAAGVLALAVAASTSLFWSAALSADQQRHMSSFGRALAQQLATLSAAPLIGGDRISLSVLASRINEPAEVASVSIYTIDDRVLAISGSASNSAPRFAHPIVFEDTIAGYARVTLSPAVFRTGPAAWQLMLWVFACTLAGLAIGYLADQRWSTATTAIPESASTDTTDPIEQESPEALPNYILVINWFNQASFPTTDRGRIIDMCLNRADQVGHLYGGQVTDLPGIGLLCTFHGAPDDAQRPERCFGVVCAALLIAEVLHEVNQRYYMRERPELAFRFGLHEDPSNTPLSELPGTDCTTDATLLSAVAANDTVAISREVFDQLEGPERFDSTPQEHAILGSLVTASPGKCTVISALSGSYRGLLDRQAERLSAQPDSTSNPSTF